MVVLALVSFKSVGKLSGGHQAAVMVLAVDDTDTADGNICVVTGSKDHYIKVCDWITGILFCVISLILGGGVLSVLYKYLFKEDHYPLLPPSCNLTNMFHLINSVVLDVLYPLPLLSEADRFKSMHRNGVVIIYLYSTAN